jgi:hypothetical protein
MFSGVAGTSAPSIISAVMLPSMTVNLTRSLIIGLHQLWFSFDSRIRSLYFIFFSSFLFWGGVVLCCVYIIPHGVLFVKCFFCFFCDFFRRALQVVFWDCCAAPTPAGVGGTAGVCVGAYTCLCRSILPMWVIIPLAHLSFFWCVSARGVWCSLAAAFIAP